ncbi:MAG: LLM class flavin-dependent oxidoreductase [Acidimicrobiia bacterium]
MILDLELNAATTDWSHLRETAVAAEEAGVGAVWVFDHLSGAVLEGDRMLECFTLLGALAASTTSIGIGSMVVNVANRHPGVLATAAASVQAISAGRFLLGIGAGAAPGSTWSREHDAIGLPLRPLMADRHAAVDDTLDLLDALWSVDRDPEHAGFPIADPRPPIIMGVSSEPLAMLAGRRCDGINVRAEHANAPDLLAAARAARAEADPAGVRPWTVTASIFFDEGLFDPEHPERLRMAALGVDRLVIVCLQPPEPDLFSRAGRSWQAT